jgi:hypothetical protein
MRALLVALCLTPAPSLAQDVDDWEFAEDPARKLSVAMARYDGGQAIIVQCRDGELTTMVAGLPATTRRLRLVDAERADGRRDRQSWFPEQSAPGSPAVFRSYTPGRDARFFKGGGQLTLRSAGGDPASMEASFDLPAQSANIDRVLTACGRPLQDERDSLVRTPFEVDWDEAVSEPRARPRGRAVGSAEISCVIREQRYTDCRVDYARPERSGRETVRAREGVRLEKPDPAAEGTVSYLTTTTFEEFIAL